MEKAACPPSLTAEYKHMKHFASPGNPLSQSLAMTTDTPAGRRQRPCHVIVPIGLLTQASCRAALGGLWESCSALGEGELCSRRLLQRSGGELQAA